MAKSGENPEEKNTEKDEKKKQYGREKKLLISAQDCWKFVTPPFISSLIIFLQHWPPLYVCIVDNVRCGMIHEANENHHTTNTPLTHLFTHSTTYIHLMHCYCLCYCSCYFFLLFFCSSSTLFYFSSIIMIFTVSLVYK